MSGNMDLKAISAVGFLLAALRLGGGINYLQGFIITTMIQRSTQTGLRRARLLKINRLPLATSIAPKGIPCHRPTTWIMSVNPLTRVCHVITSS